MSNSNPIPDSSQVRSTSEPPTKWQIYTAADPMVERIIPSLAKEIGLNESIVLMQIAFWIKTSNNIADGAYWTYQTMEDMQQKAFPYWSINTIRRIVHNLAKKGYILIGQYNKRKGDNTQWYALEPDKLSSLKSIIVKEIELEDSTPSSQVGRVASSQVDSTPLQVGSTVTRDITTEKKKNTLVRTPILDPVWDAISAVWKTKASAIIGNMKAMMSGTAKNGEWAAANFDPPANPAEILDFGKWYARKNPDLSLPRKPEKIQHWFYEFRQATAKKITPLDPALDLSKPTEFTLPLYQFLDKAVGDE